MFSVFQIIKPALKTEIEVWARFSLLRMLYSSQLLSAGDTLLTDFYGIWWRVQLLAEEQFIVFRFLSGSEIFISVNKKTLDCRIYKKFLGFLFWPKMTGFVKKCRVVINAFLQLCCSIFGLCHQLYCFDLASAAAGRFISKQLSDKLYNTCPEPNMQTFTLPSHTSVYTLVSWMVVFSHCFFLSQYLHKNII